MLRRSLIISSAASFVAVPALAAQSANAIGVSLPITGVQAEVASEMRAGYEAALAKSGLVLKVLDDAYLPDKTAKNISEFAMDSQIFVASGIVGTSNAQKAIPFARAGGLPVVGIRSGAEFFRDGAEGVYHLRTSYDRELDKTAVLCQHAGINRMAIIYADDAFGKSNKDYLTSKLDAAGISVIASVPVNREGLNIERATKQAAIEVLKQGTGGAAVFMSIVSKPMAQAAQLLRERDKIIAPIFAMSIVANSMVCENAVSYLTGLGLVSAFPLPRSRALPVTQQFAADIGHIKRLDLTNSLAAFEGWFYASTILQAHKIGMRTRADILRNLSNSSLDVYGQKIEFNKKNVGFEYLKVFHKGSDGMLRE